MTQRSKGFTLIELLITVSLVGIVAAVAVPSFSSLIQKSKADGEVGALQRALNYARMEAINRGVGVKLVPSTAGAAWNTELKVVLTADASATALRTIGALSSGATVTANGVSSIEFNNLGGLSVPNSAVVMTYTLGSITRTMNIALSGRIVSSGN